MYASFPHNCKSAYIYVIFVTLQLIRNCASRVIYNRCQQILSQLLNEALKWLSPSGGRGGEGAILGSIFTTYVPLTSQNPYHIMVYYVANCRPHFSHYWENVNFCLCIYFINPLNRVILKRIDTFVKLNIGHLNFHLQSFW